MTEKNADSQGSASPGLASGLERNVFQLKDRTSEFGAKIWTLVFDLPGEKVNKLGERTMREFEQLITRLEGMKDQIDAVVLVSGKKGNFIAGADIQMIQAVKSSQEAEQLSRLGQKLADRWEDLPFATVAAIDGTALGGGCELALASTALVMSANPAAKIGLPETMLGIIPGMGGCVRLPRKVGLATAFDMILSAKQLSGERAYKAGLADGYLPAEDFETSVHRWTKSNLGKLQAGVRIAKEPKLGGMGGAMGSLMEKNPVGRMVIFKKAREGVMAKTKGHYPAVIEAINVVQANGGKYGPKVRGAARERAMEREAAGFGKMAATDVSRNLIRIFFMTEDVKKSNGLPAGNTVKVAPARSAAVIGAGVMGGGIAQLYADKNVPGRMKDLNVKALALGMQAASKIFLSQVKKKRLNKRQYLQKLNLIAPVTDYSGFETTDVVVEAIVENMEIKQKVLREAEEHVKDDCVIASNTSSLSISKMQSAMKHPERFGGMHFFNPVHRMPLVEVIRGDKTDDHAVATIFQFSKQLGKTPIVVKDAPGFLVNRLLMPYLNEATWLLVDGAPIPEIDRAMLAFGMPMGPMELIDEVGVDVGAKVAHILHEGFGDRMQPAPANDKIVKEGRLGKKSGKGLYEYEGRNKSLNPAVYDILGVSPQSGRISDEEIVERCVLPMINEASRCLEESIVSTAAEVDLGMIMGTGFPPFRGGLLRYADTLGPQAIVERLKHYQQKFGARYEPAPAMLKRAASGQKFY